MKDHTSSALVLAGHGSTVNADSSAPTQDHAAELRRRGLFAEVHACFWKEEPSFREVLRMVESDDVYIVPNFISEGYFTQTVIPREFALDGPVTHRDGRVLKYCDPVGSHARMTEALLHRARAIAPGLNPADISLFIVGHGTGLNDNSAVAAKAQAKAIEAAGLYGQVLSTYMEEPPLIAEWDRLATRPTVVVVPFFIADGLHSYEDIPVLLGLEGKGSATASRGEIFLRNPYHLRGKTLYFASAIGTEPMMADVIVDQVGAFDRRHG